MDNVIDFKQAQVDQATKVLAGRVAHLREVAKGVHTLADMKAQLGGVEDAAVKAAEAAVLAYGSFASDLADYHEALVAAFEDELRLDVVPVPTVGDIAALAVFNASSMGYVEAGLPGSMLLSQKVEVLLYVAQTMCAPKRLARAMVWHMRAKFGDTADEVLFAMARESAVLAATIRAKLKPLDVTSV